MGGLIGIVTTEKNGLMSRLVYRDTLQTISRLQGGQAMLIAQFSKDYEGLNIRGVNSANGGIVDVYISRDPKDIKGKGICPGGVTFYTDVDLNIYIKVAPGSLLYASIIGLSNCTLAISYTSLPADSTQIAIGS